MHRQYSTHRQHCTLIQHSTHRQHSTKRQHSSHRLYFTYMQQAHTCSTVHTCITAHYPHAANHPQAAQHPHAAQHTQAVQHPHAAQHPQAAQHPHTAQHPHAAERDAGAPELTHMHAHYWPPLRVRGDKLVIKDSSQFHNGLLLHFSTNYLTYSARERVPGYLLSYKGRRKRSNVKMNACRFRIVEIISQLFQYLYAVLLLFITNLLLTYVY